MTGVDERLSSPVYGDDDVAGNDGLTTMDATVDELRSGDDCAQTINSTSAINRAAVEAAPTTRGRPPPIANWLGLTIDDRPWGGDGGGRHHFGQVMSHPPRLIR